MPEIIAFSADQLSRLTGLSLSRVAYWDRTGFFTPTLIDEYRRRTFGRIYSFRDVVGLRTIAILRNEHKIPLQELRRVDEWLHREHETPWASLCFALAGRRVVFFDPHTGVPMDARSGQAHLQVALEPIAAEMQTAADTLKQRSPEQIGQVVRNRYVVRNAWVIAGTRIPSKSIWHFHQAGYSTEKILREYPTLTAGDVQGAIDAEAKRRRIA